MTRNDKGWRDALAQAGISSRREQIAETRALHRRMARRHGYWKMFIAALAVNVVLGWALMIAVGVLHGEWWRTVPTMGYHAAYLVTGLLFLGFVSTVIIVQTARDS